MTAYTLDLFEQLDIGEQPKFFDGKLSLHDSLEYTSEIDFSIRYLELSDSLGILEYSDAIGADIYRQSKYGKFKYGELKYGMNVEVLPILAISEQMLIKVNGGFLIPTSDSLSIVDNLSTFVTYHLGLSDSIVISDSINIRIGINRALSDSLSISENVGNGTTLNISDSLSSIIASLSGLTLTEGKTLKTNWRFLIRTKTGSYVASLVNARSRWFKEALNHGGSAGFILDAEDANCNSTILAINSNELIIQYKGYDMWGGQLATVRKVANGNDRYREVTAVQFFNLFSYRYCGYNKSTGLSELREFTTTDAGTIAWTLISEAQAEVNGSFGITLGTIQASLNRTKSYERKNIAEAIIELADNDYGFDFEITTDKVFNVFYPFKGTVRDEVVFRYPGNCLEMESMENGLEVVNSELGLGRNWGGQEIYYIVDDAGSQVSYGRREKIESYKDVEIQAYLNDMVTEDVAWSKDINKVVKFKSFIDKKSDLYMYELGDSVRVVADAFDIDESLFVYERSVTIDEADQPTVSLTLGD